MVKLNNMIDEFQKKVRKLKNLNKSYGRILISKAVINDLTEELKARIKGDKDDK